MTDDSPTIAFDSLSVLVQELNASAGSFVAGVRFDLRWDAPKFSRLCEALHAAAKAHAGAEALPRDLSQLFWYCGTIIPMLVGQRDFRAGQPHVNYDKACALLKRLGDESFGDECLMDDREFDEALTTASLIPDAVGRHS